MSITVTKPFTRRSALRELGIYFHSGRLSKDDYVMRRAQLIDHLCGLSAELDPVLTMLLRSAMGGKGKSEVTAPQQDTTKPLTPATASGAGEDSQERLLKMLLVAIIITAVSIAGGWWWTRKHQAATVLAPAVTAQSVAPVSNHNTGELEQRLLDFSTGELTAASANTLLQSWAAASAEQQALAAETPAYRTFRRGLKDQLQVLQAYSPEELSHNAVLDLIQQLAATLPLADLQATVQRLRPSASAAVEPSSAPPVTPPPLPAR